MTMKEVKRLHELAVSTDYATHISTNTEIYSVSETPDPPDAVLKSSKGNFVWLEITDVFRSAEEARDVYSFATGGSYRRPYGLITAPDTKISYSTVQGVERKINKESYQEILNKYDKGVLILWIFDPLFSDSTLNKISESFENQSLSSPYFKEVYIYWPATKGRIFTKILG